MLFSERTVAQMAAFFLDKNGGPMSLLKLMKLLYLAERESLSRHGIPICGDFLVAMPHGPVLSLTCDLASGSTEGSDWNEWISDRENHEVSLKKPVGPESLDEMSRNSMSVLESTWEKFGEYNHWQIRDYTHRHCPEWEDPQGSSHPIPYQKLFLALGWSRDDAVNVSEQLAEQAALEEAFRFVSFQPRHRSTLPIPSET